MSRPTLLEGVGGVSVLYYEHSKNLTNNIYYAKIVEIDKLKHKKMKKKQIKLELKSVKKQKQKQKQKQGQVLDPVVQKQVDDAVAEGRIKQGEVSQDKKPEPYVVPREEKKLEVSYAIATRVIKPMPGNESW